MIETDKIYQGDCIDIMRSFEDNSIDSIVEDSPYGFAFMGKNWDKFSPMGFLRFTYRWAKEALRILKPGAHLLNFSAPRKYHLMACGVELAGFKIKDMIIWAYSQGIPKGPNLSVVIDKKLGVYELRKKIGIRYRHGGGTEEGYMGMTQDPKVEVTEPYSEEAKYWDGWGTGLKPAVECIIVAQKPKEGNYAENVLKHGVGGKNIDKCRVPYIREKETDSRIYNPEKNITRGTHEGATVGYAPDGNEYPMYNSPQGRWPTNLILDPESALLLDQQSGISKGGKQTHNREIHRRGLTGEGPFNSFNCGFDVNKGKGLANFGDKGGVSRFFYCAKVHPNERNAGCNGLYWEIIGDDFKKISKNQYDKLPKKQRAKGNPILTLKPINLMRYLTRLVTPPGGKVLDPFAGSGTTGIACIIEGFHYILIEKRDAFVKFIIPKRLTYWKDPKNWTKLKDHPNLPKIEILKNKKQNQSLENWITNGMEVSEK